PAPPAPDLAAAPAADRVLAAGGGRGRELDLVRRARASAARVRGPSPVVLQLMSEGLRFVLIRGLAREAGHWHEFDVELRERFADAVVERHDLPGNGARFREPSPLAISAMAADLRARVQAADRRAPVLIAISLGAMVCLEWLRSWPEDPIVGLVAINTSIGGICRPWERMRVPAMLHTLRALAERDPVAREL